MINATILKAIREAIKQGDLQEVIRLIGDDKERLSMMTAFGTWLHVAADYGKIDICQWLVANGINLNAYGGIAGGGALQGAASEGHLDVVRYLLECGADLDISEPERNPLFGAIHGRHPEIAKMLIDHGIDTQVRYPRGEGKTRNALEYAREWGCEEIVALLENCSPPSTKRGG